MICGRTFLVLMVVNASLTAFAAAQENPTTKPAYRVEQTQLGPYFLPMEESAESQDGLHTCQVVTEAVYRWNAGPGPNNLPHRMRVYLDGQPGQEFQSIIKDSLKFSPDGRHIAYAAINNDKQFVVRDDKIYSAYDGAILFSLTFSPDSQRLAYAVRKGNRCFVVVDGDELEQFDDVFGDTIAFSPDSHRLSYFSEDGKQEYAVVDGRPGLYMMVDREFPPIRYGQPPPDWWPSGRSLDHVIFSPDSKHVAYVSHMNSKNTLMEDGNAISSTKTIVGITFSPDSQHLAYLSFSAENSRQGRLIVDGKEDGPSHDRVFGPVFSPDSRHVGYTAWDNGKSYVVIDGQAGPPYQPTPLVLGIHRPIFSPDSKRVAYVAQEENGKQLVLIDGQPSATFDRIFRSRNQEKSLPDILFSPDSRYYAFVAIKNSKYIVVRDGTADAEHDLIGDVRFNADSTHLAYQALDDKYSIFLDGHPLAANTAMASPVVFSPDSKRVAIIAQSPNHNLHVEIDGDQGPTFHSLVGYGPSFNADGVLEYLAEKDNILYRVKHIPLQPAG